MKEESKKTKKQSLTDVDRSNKDVLRVIKQTLFDKCEFDGESGVAVALSGGPDSVCLLFLLKQISDSLGAEQNSNGFKITAVHLNHCLRGAESERDERFCIELCQRLGIELVVDRIDIASEAAKAKKGLEEYGRFARYKLFERVCVEKGIKYVAVGHNKEDNAETIFMNIARGTGADGLKGISFSRLLGEEPLDGGNIHIIRPMLRVSRAQIEQVCAENDLQPIIDSSNLETDYRRNKVRLNIFPMIEEHLQMSIVDKLCEMSERIVTDEKHMEKITEIIYNKALVENEKSLCLDTDLLFAEDEAIINRVIRKAYGNVSKSMVDFGMSHVDAVANLCRQEVTGKRLDLPHNVQAVLRYGKLFFEKKSLGDAEEKISGINITAKDILSSPNGYTISVVKVDDSKFLQKKVAGVKFAVQQIENSCDACDKQRMKFFCPKRNRPYEMWFDFDKLFNDEEPLLEIRSRLLGDVIVPVTSRRTKKFKEFLIDEKIPREERDEIILLAKGSDVVWAVGIMPDNRFLVDENTKRACNIQIEFT